MIDVFLQKEVPSGFENINFSSEAFCNAYKALISPHVPFLAIMGPGGCGKSILYKMAAAYFGDRAMCLAATGVAAYNLRTQYCKARTIHAGLHIEPREIFKPMDVFNVDLEQFRKTDIILIDEISMVNANLLDLIIDTIFLLYSYTGKLIRLAVFGDPLQLPPVITDEVKPLFAGYDTPFFFSSKFWLRLPVLTIPLDTVYRQAGTEYKQLLSRIRIGKPSDDDFKFLDTRVSREPPPDTLILSFSNNAVNRINEEKLQELANSDTPRIQVRKTHRTRGTYETSHFLVYKGEKVMLTCNKYDNCGEPVFQNGTIGTIVDFTNEDLPVVAADGGRHFTVDYEFFDSDGVLTRDPSLWAFEALPMKPAYAVTYHKAQGLTLDRVHLDIDKNCRFPSVIYLGLSRVKDPEGLTLSSRVWESLVRVDEAPVRYLKEVGDVSLISTDKKREF